MNTALLYCILVFWTVLRENNSRSGHRASDQPEADKCMYWSAAAPSASCNNLPVTEEKQREGPFVLFPQLISSNLWLLFRDFPPGYEASAPAVWMYPRFFLMLHSHLCLWNWFILHCHFPKSAFLRTAVLDRFTQPYFLLWCGEQQRWNGGSDSAGIHHLQGELRRWIIHKRRWQKLPWVHICGDILVLGTEGLTSPTAPHCCGRVSWIWAPYKAILLLNKGSLKHKSNFTLHPHMLHFRFWRVGWL